MNLTLVASCAKCGKEWIRRSVAAPNDGRVDFGVLDLQQSDPPCDCFRSADTGFTTAVHWEER